MVKLLRVTLALAMLGINMPVQVFAKEEPAVQENEEESETDISEEVIGEETTETDFIDESAEEAPELSLDEEFSDTLKEPVGYTIGNDMYYVMDYFLFDEVPGLSGEGEVDIGTEGETTWYVMAGKKHIHRESQLSVTSTLLSGTIRIFI